MPKPKPNISDFRQRRLLEWLLTPIKDREPPHLRDLAEELSVSRRTLTEWKSDADFLKEWERAYRNGVGSPERKQAILDTLYRTATDPDDPKHVQAADKYLQAVDAIAPQKLDVTVSKSVTELTDEQLAQLAAAKALDYQNRDAS